MGLSLTGFTIVAVFAAVNFVECPKCDKRIRISEDGKEAVVNLGGRETNDLVWRDVNVSASGMRCLVFRCASQGKRTFFVQLDGGEKTPLTIPATGDGFVEASLSVKLEAGKHSIRLSNDAAPMPDIDFMRIQL